MIRLRFPAPDSARLTWVLARLTIAAFLLAAPGAVGVTRERGEIYAFSWRLLADIPVRLMGPGRFRFILQPIMAGTLGVRDGMAAARAGGGSRFSGRAFANLVLVAILLGRLPVGHPGDGPSRRRPRRRAGAHRLALLSGPRARRSRDTAKVTRTPRRIA